jgi:hypothetical protein
MEDQRLREEFEKRVRLLGIAQWHGRTMTSIAARLVRLERVTERNDARRILHSKQLIEKITTVGDFRTLRAIIARAPVASS